MSQASDIIQQAAQKFEELQRADPFNNREKSAKIIDEMIQALPEGEEKAFFARIEESIKPVEKILQDIQEGYEADTQEAIQTLKKLKKSLTRNAVPQAIPGVIVEELRGAIAEGILTLKMLDGLL